MGRLFFDLSSLARWSGPPVGIIRVQQTLAQFARGHRPDAEFTLFDPRLRTWRRVRPEFVDPLIASTCRVQLAFSGDASGNSQRLRDRLPPPLRSGYYWLTKPRRKALLLAERRRISARSNLMRRLHRSVFNTLLKQRERSEYFDPNGRRIDRPTLEQICSDPVTPAVGDVTIGAQADWIHTDISAIRESRARHGFRHVVLCHDLIPLLFPEWYESHDIEQFRAYFDVALPTADRVIASSENTRRDIQNYCVEIGSAVPEIRVVPLGAEPASLGTTQRSLPDGLSSGKYALFVSTIEPRKNHRLLVEVWRRLLEEKVPQRHEFSLVFVGRPGWKMQDFLPSLREDSRLRGNLHVLHDVDDAQLASLYAESAFCVYPPIYEGFGLPAIEAQAWGKPLLASSGGSIPEAVDPTAVLIDPASVDDWYRWMKQWISVPESRPTVRPVPARTCAESARHFFDVVSELATQTDEAPRWAA